MKYIKYQKGYKYQLARDYTCHISILGHEIETQYISLNSDGWLTIRKGYAWDGPSGPTIDTKTFMRGSLIHDALYQLHRLDLLSRENRVYADMELKKACLEDGMCSFRAWYTYECVREFAEGAAHPDNKRQILTAP